MNNVAIIHCFIRTRNKIMLINAIKKIFSSSMSLTKAVSEIRAYERSLTNLSDEDLQKKSHELSSEVRIVGFLSQLQRRQALAIASEASQRKLGMRPYDVQLMGALALLDGRIAEMKTGEGKTLVAGLAAYVEGLTGRGVHVVTVNDYLAKRDHQILLPLFSFLGITSSTVPNGNDNVGKRAAYAQDVVYVTNSELGFDYLRDNMKSARSDFVLRPLNFAIVDEADSVFIDEARTPLVISNAEYSNSEAVAIVYGAVGMLDDIHVDVDLKRKTIHLTEAGIHQIESILSSLGILKGGHIYDMRNLGVLHEINQSLKARYLFQKDKDYIVQDDKVIIIDEFTGRAMPDRRYSNGLHQALEAKEHVTIRPETKTLASTTYQKFFSLYPKLSGMTGTAQQEAEEFFEVYDLKVVTIPPNKPVIRKDHPDRIFFSALEKYAAIVDEVKRRHRHGQPILVGTSSIEISGFLSDLLKKENITHMVLNAKNHEKEAQIIAEAGRKNAVTIATNMAGRGTDILLGGLFDENLRSKDEHDSERKEVMSLGGLCVIGTERHESRRIDDQLRGRSGRQGDPGESIFYVSLEDELMKKFADQKILSKIVEWSKRENSHAEHKSLSKMVLNAQLAIEGHNSEIRRELLKYDNVIAEQRIRIYDERIKVMDSDDIYSILHNFVEDVLIEFYERELPIESYPDQWNDDKIAEYMKYLFEFEQDSVHSILQSSENALEARERFDLIVDDKLRSQLATFGDSAGTDLLKTIIIQCIDDGWQDQISRFESLRTGVGLRSYAQLNPLFEFQNDALNLYQSMSHRIKSESLRMIFHLIPASSVDGLDDAA